MAAPIRQNNDIVDYGLPNPGPILADLLLPVHPVFDIQVVLNDNPAEAHENQQLPEAVLQILNQYNPQVLDIAGLIEPEPLIVDIVIPEPALLDLHLEVPNYLNELLSSVKIPDYQSLAHKLADDLLSSIVDKELNGFKSILENFDYKHFDMTDLIGNMNFSNGQAWAVDPDGIVHVS
jgi:hypothetical protein